MKGIHILLVLLGLTVMSCTEEKLTSETIVQNSISFHDPSGKWNSLQANVQFKSQFPPGEKHVQDLTILIDNPNQTYGYKNDQRAVNVLFEKDACKVLGGKESCEALYWTKNFYPYIWGLPMKLHDEGTQIDPSYSDTTFHSMLCHKIHVDYGNHNWWYYIDQESFALRGFQFHNRDNGNKEYVVLKNDTQCENIIYPTLRIWYHTETNECVGTNELVKLIVLPPK